MQPSASAPKLRAIFAAHSPLHDRTGALSALRLIVLALCAAPAFWLAYKWNMGLLSPKPVTDIIRQSGDWAIRFLVVALAISPLRNAARWNAIIGVRRMIGLAALFYVGVHLTFYFIEQNWVWMRIAREIVLRTYLTIGFAGVLMLLALGATSHDAMVKRLGAPRWLRLHQLVYGVALLAIVHYFMQVRIKAWEPSLIAGLLVFLASVRLLRRWRGTIGVLALIALAVIAGLATALIEALYYTYSMNAPFMLVLKSNLDFEWEIRPAWYALALCLVLPLAQGLRVALHALRASRPSSSKSSLMKTETAQHH